MLDALRGVWTTVWSNRRRLAPAVLLLGMVVVGSQVLGVWPHETEIRFDFGPDHGAITRARIAYTIDGGEAFGARFEWPSGAPERVRHVVSLHPGRYVVVAELDTERGRRRIERTLVVPAEGVVRIALFEETAANLYAWRSP